MCLPFAGMTPRMRIFVAGASGVLGTRLVPLLVAGGHDVTGMTRSADNAARLEELGAEPVVCDVFDIRRLMTSLNARPTRTSSSTS